MATENIVISISETGARSVSRNIEDVGKSANAAASGVNVLKTALAALMTVMSFNVFKEFSSTWVQLKSQVDGFTSSMGETNAVMDRLVEIANRNKAALDITAQTYIGNAAALTELGYSTKSQIDFTEAMSNALTVSGAKGQKAETVINALSKAMMKGKLDGMNWQTVLQQGGRVVTALADGLGVTLAELRKMATDGDLSSNSVFTALTSQLEKLAEEADKMPSTMNDALQELTTSFTAAIGKFDEDFGITEKFVSVVQTISENLNIILPIIYGIGAAIAVAFLPTVLSAFWASLNMIWLLLMTIPAAPFLALGVAIAGVGTALYGMRDEIKLGIDETTTLGNLMTVVGEDISDVWQSVKSDLSTIWHDLTTEAPAALNAIDTANSAAASSITKEWNTLFSNLENGWVGAIQFILRVFDLCAVTIRGGINAVSASWGIFTNGIQLTWKNAVNYVLQNAEKMANGVINTLNGVLKFAGMEQIKNVKIPQYATEPNLKAMADQGKKLANSMTDAMRDQQRNGLEAAWKNTLKRAQAKGGSTKDSAIGSKNTPTNPLGDAGKGKKGGKDNASKELDDLTKAYQALKGTLDPIWKAQQEVAQGEETLNKALSAGLVSLEEKDRLMGLLNEKYKDALDPLGKINRDMQKELDLLKLDANSRKIKIELDQRIQALQAKGVVLIGTETEELRKKIALQQEELKLAQIKDSVIANSGVGQLKTFTDQMEAVKRALNSGAISGPDATNAIRSFLPDADQVLAGTQMIVDAQLSKFENLYKMIDVMKQKNLIDDQQYSLAQINIAKMEQDAKMEMIGGFWGTLSTLSSSGNSKLAAIGKASAVAQATMSAFVAGNRALAEGGPYAGPAMQAAIIAQGMINVAQIAATNLGFKTGGSFIVGGSGAPDSQQVAFRASPGEKVSITKANNVKKGDQQEGESGSSSSGGGVRIVNVLGDSVMENFMTSSAGEKVILNAIENNPSAIRTLLE